MINIENGGQADLILGTMFSGKTTYALSKIAKMAELNYSILYVNIDFDTRSKEAFSTHNPFLGTDENFNKQDAIKRNVQMIKSKRLSGLDIESKDVIVIDEAHFFDDLVQFVNNCLNKSKYVIIVSLVADFEGNKFGKALDLAPICTNIKKLHAYCSECAKDKKCCLATYSKRIIESKKA